MDYEERAIRLAKKFHDSKNCTNEQMQAVAACLSIAIFTTDEEFELYVTNQDVDSIDPAIDKFFEKLKIELLDIFRD